MSEDFFLRDDIIELNSKLDSECFNIKAYRKLKSKSKKVSLLGALTTGLGSSDENILKNIVSLNKNDFSINQISERRISMTAGINHRAKISSNIRNSNHSVNVRTQIPFHKKSQQGTHPQDPRSARISYDSVNKDIETNNKISFFEEKLQDRSNNQLNRSSESIAKNNYKQLQTKYNKNGPINDRHIENWLNQILMEYCHEEHFDKSIENAALKKMSIDKNSLLSQGIHPEYVKRVYKSMFVYSIGFNNLLKQLSGRNTHLKKTIWKVYAILLQFCSEGTFQTMIGEIERDKAKKIQSLREQIEKRQRIIENNDEINEQKNAKIFKELKVLREQNTNLENQKNVLMEDFKEAEQSFNQEVSLRLKFQNKINQIHGIHHELSTKHNRLYDDYHKKVHQIQVLQQKFKQLAQNNLINKEKLVQTCEELEAQKKENSHQNQFIEKFEQMRTRFQNSEIELKSSREDLLNIIKQKSRKISQLQIELQNSEIMLNLSKSSSKQLEHQYREQLDQNKKLHSTIQDQMVQLNSFFTEKKNFNEKHISYVAEIQFLKAKDSENKFVITKLQNQLKQINSANSQLNLEKMTLDKKVFFLEENLNDCYQNIENMKKIKNLYEEELLYLKKNSEIHGQVVREKETLISTLTKTSEKLTKQNGELLISNKNLDSKASVLAQRLRSQEQINKKKLQKLKDQRDQLFKQNSEHNAVLQQKINQLEKYMSLYDKQMLNLKNQRFQRVNLDLRYKQSLQVMESQNQYIKKLKILISENNEEIQEWKRKHRNFEYILKEKQHLFDVQKTSLKTYLEEARNQLNKKKMFINPMLLQDLKGLLKREIQKYQDLLKLHNEKIIQFKTKQEALNSLINSNNKNHLIQLQQDQAKFQKRFSEKQYELQYQKQKSKHLQQKIEELEKIMNQSKYSSDSSPISKQKERKYLGTIKEKSQHIEKLLKQLQNAHDHINTLAKRVGELEEITNKKNFEITELQRKYTKISQQMEVLEMQRATPHPNLNLYKQTVSSKMDDYEESPFGVINNQNHLTPSFHRQNHQRNQAIRQSSSQSNRKATGRQEQKEGRQEQTGFNHLSKQKKQKTQKIVNPVWRNDLGKKLKNAYNYYQK